MRLHEVDHLILKKNIDEDEIEIKSSYVIQAIVDRFYGRFLIVRVHREPHKV
jgi:hypothetical protein